MDIKTPAWTLTLEELKSDEPYGPFGKPSKIARLIEEHEDEQILKELKKPSKKPKQVQASGAIA